MEYTTAIFHGKYSVLLVPDHHAIKHDVVRIPFKVFVVRKKPKMLTNGGFQGKPQLRQVGYRALSLQGESIFREPGIEIA